MAGISDIDREFVDRLVIAIAAKHEGENPSKGEVESWFKFAVQVAIAREVFWDAHSDACANDELD